MATTVTVSVLFTDLVGSTDLRSRVGHDRADELRREHFAVLREAIARRGGKEVKNLETGHGHVSDASDTLAAAVAIQQRVEVANRGADEPLGLRIGVSMGDADLDDGDYFGVPVIEASRLCGLAEGGQILTTEFVRALAAARGSHTFEPLGLQVELKGLDDPVPACALVWTPLAAVVGVEVPLPPRLSGEIAAGFFGRDPERALLAGALKEAETDARRRVVLIGGEPGIGKTTLAAEVARGAHEAGATVLYGRSDEDLGIPYQPWIEALAHLVEHVPDVLVNEHVTEAGGELARLVPGLGAHRPGLPAPQVTDPVTERYLLFGAVKSLLATVSAHVPVVLVLDDLHWADTPTLVLLRHLVVSPERLRLLLVGTFRESEVSAGHPLAEVLAALHREQGVDRISLHGLDDVELLELMAAAAGHEMGDDGVSLAHALRHETDGNPFFVTEILRHLAESGAIYQEDGRWVASADLRDSGLPISVREVIGRRVARLGDATMRVLGVAAVIGRDFDASVVAEVAEVSEDDLLDVLDGAVDAALVEETLGTPGRYTFAHALIEHTLYDDLGANRRARTHRRVAETLEASLGADPGDRLGELAYHWSEATAPQDAAKTIDYTRRAGDRALAQLAPDEALRWYRQAVGLLDRSPIRDEVLRCELRVGIGDAQRQAGVPGSREVLLDAAHLAQDLGHAELMVRAALANFRGFAGTIGEVDRERIAAVEAALNVAEGPSRARLLAILASELAFAGDFPRVRALSEEALGVARRAGDPATVSFVLYGRFSAIGVPETLAQRSAEAEEQMAIADQLGDPLVGSRAWMAIMQTAVERGDTDAAAPAVAMFSTVAEQLGQPGLRWLATGREALAALLRGEPDAAEALAEASLHIGTDSGEPDALAIYVGYLIAVRWHQGRLPELEPVIAQAATDNPGVPAFGAEVAHCRIERGDDAGARALLAAAGADRFASVPYDIVWSTTLALWAEVAAHLDAVDAAPPLLELLAPYDDVVVFNGVSTFGPVADYLGMLETIMGRFELADARFAHAMQIHERFRAPFFTARTLLHRAVLCRRRAAQQDVEAARALLGDARTLARRHGFAGLEREIQALGSLHPSPPA